MTRRAAAGAAWLALAALAALPLAASAASAASAAEPVVLRVQAPDELRALLERHLDLARLALLPADEAPDDLELTRLMGAAPAQARELLQTEGYFAAQVSVQRRPAEADVGPARLQMTVVPGPRTQVERFTLLTEGEFDRALAAGDAEAQALLGATRAQWALAPGQPMRNAAWADAKSALLARLRAAGYASAAYSGTAAEVDAERQRARLTVVLDSGPLYRAGPLRIEGLQRQDEATVRHLAGFAPGVPLTEQLLLDYQDRLVKTGLFDRATVSFDAEPELAASTPVVVQLHEQPLQQATLGVGFSANTGPRVSLEHRHRRIFGFAATAYNKVEWGRDRQAWEGEINTHPGEGFWRNLAGAQIERLKSDTDTVLSQRLRLGRAQDSERLERLIFVEAERDAQSSDGTRVRAIALSLNHHWVFRRLDSVLLPTRGWTLSLQAALGQADSNVGERGAFARLYGRGTLYWPLGASWYGQARLELGQVVSRDAVRVPATLGFRAGGDDSVRGYAYRSLAPTVDGTLTSGRVLATGSVELARPVSAALPSVWGAVFVDAGNAAARWGELTPARGYGVGVRWRSPVGPLKLDWAWGEQVRRGRLHFSVGIAF